VVLPAEEIKVAADDVFRPEKDKAVGKAFPYVKTVGQERLLYLKGIVIASSTSRIASSIFRFLAATIFSAPAGSWIIPRR
jgi:hypothetical protein